MKIFSIFAIVLSLLGAANVAMAQLTIPEPGPAGPGIPIAPGSAISGYTPGGIGPGGTRIAPGPAAQGIPMYHPGLGLTPPSALPSTGR